MIARFMKNMTKWIRRISITIIAIVLISVIGFWAWVQIGHLSASAAATEVALSAKNPTHGWLIFNPKNTTDKGLIIYPGGLVDANAYAPLAKTISDQGFLVVVVPMPFELAIFNFSAADAVQKAYPSIRTWSIGGHSLGGSMACEYTRTNKNLIESGKLRGLVLWAAYCNSVDVGQKNVVSIYGTQDGLINKYSAEQLTRGLPAQTNWVIIGGGNHAMFGDYGAQSGDNPMTISIEQARGQIVDATVSFLRSIP
jgi:pimeloyl-ACP methyl ester carboxylesterase